MAQKAFTVYRTHHGPIVREADGKWVSVRLMQEPLKALTQSYSRTKANGYQAFRESMELHTNSSNNTIYADADGNIAYFHSNFIPKRDPKFDWTRPVDGSNPATEWNGVLSIDESPDCVNPPTGGCTTRTTGRGPPPDRTVRRRRTIRAYVERGSGESARPARHPRARRRRRTSRSSRSIAAAYDSYLPAFETQIPALLAGVRRDAGQRSTEGETGRADRAAARLGLPLGGRRRCRRRWPCIWGEEAGRRWPSAARRGGHTCGPVHRQTTRHQSSWLAALAAASDKLAADFGTWKTPWGDINRFQRLTGDIVQPFDDAGRASRSASRRRAGARWRRLAPAPTNGTKKMYGTSGNSFVAVVEFGDRVRAKAVSAGGQSGDPKSKHFNDQATRYATGDLRDVYFYKDQLQGHTERQYHPGQ